MATSTSHPAGSSWLPSFLRREATVAPPGFNRWLIPPAALAVHLCIGQVYATSVYKNALVAHFDASLTAIGIIFSIAIVMLGLSAAVGRHLGRPQRAAGGDGRRGPVLVDRLPGGALGISSGQLWLVYLGYGVIGGIGLGHRLHQPGLDPDQVVPRPPGAGHRHGDHGLRRRRADRQPAQRPAAGLLRQRVRRQPTRRRSPAAQRSPRCSSRSASSTSSSCCSARSPFGCRPTTGSPDGWDPSQVKQKKLVTTASVSAGNAIKTPQFWLLWVVLFCNVTAGIGILEQAAPMIQDFFREGDTSTVSAAAAGGFVGLLSLANMGGRFIWSSTSDVIGRKPIYMVYLGGGMVLYVLLALVGHTSTALFVLLAAVILSFYGGGFATVPAYLRDLFGTFEVGAIHGRLLTAWSAAGVAGPLIVNKFLDAEGEPGKLTAADYRLALLTMVVLLAIGFVSNLLIRPVAERFHEPDDASLPKEGVSA